MALPGISNANEFYSAHYLESVLTGDIKKVRERWAEEARAELEADPTAEISTPEQRFKALRRPWQKLRESELGITGDPAERLRLQRELLFRPLLEALGYPFDPRAEPVLIGGEAYQVPLLAEITNAKGEPWLWAVECFNPSDEPADPLELTIATRWGCQIDDPSLGTVLTRGDGQGSETWEELISERVFGQDVPPRWVLAVSRDQVLLIDRQKWAASRLLRFEFETLLGDNNPDALLAAATLLHREHTCPSGGGTPLLDELDENSHKHAYEVSTDLKYALRRSIELLGNEAITWLKTKAREGVYKGETDARALTFECLRYMYRLLFLFYIESRPDLGYAPMGSDVYRLGYSLESLRDMDNAELASEEDKESTYISDSLDRLFQMIWEGYPRRDDETAQLPLADAEDPFHDSFRLTPLKAHLFDPARMPTLTRVRFRNVVLREVIELMSLTKEGKGKRRGRVSYSQLGINQLGAVYEALLSFRGFFAEEDLYEVQPAPKKGKAAASEDDDEFEEDSDDEAGDDISTKASGQATGQAHDELEVGHFVTAEQLKAYKAEEIVPDPGSGLPKCYPKGSFIYRLAGRDREKSASYYTPESLTQCLVKYALKELLPGKSAADILALKVCEPAMGSAAFLNEVVNQLAQAYLERRQQETGRSLPHEQFATELQKVKMRLADQNVFGVDLNPVAVELAEVSLWLNSIFTPESGRAFVPWFSQQLVCGNSLIGARRQIYRVSQLPTGTGRKAKPTKLWHEHAPEELAWDAELPKDGIFHFLLPDPGMAAYTDKVIKELEPDSIDRCKRWNKAFVAEPFTDAQVAHLLRLSKLVAALWSDWATQQTQLRRRTTDPLPVWQDPTGAVEGDWTPLKLKDRIQEQEVLGRDVANTNARLRLKWAMDYWCALWFWPIPQAGSLPSRDSWLLELSMILGDLEQGVAPELGQGNLFADTQPRQQAVDFSDRHGFVDVEKLKAEFERLHQVEAVARRIRPLHWELEFADIFMNNGFDVAIGNPPWIKLSWEDQGILGEINPIVSIRSLSKREATPLRRNLLEEQANLLEYISEYIFIAGSQNFFDANYGLFAGQMPNLYKCFIDLCLNQVVPSGTIALLHPDGAYIDPASIAFRLKGFKRLKYLFQFRNEKRLFDILNTRTYCISVWGSKEQSLGFDFIAKLFQPSTIDSCLLSQEEAILGIKDANGDWNTRGSRDRVIHVDEKTLTVFSLVSGDEEIASSRLQLATSGKLLGSLQKIAECGKLERKTPLITNNLEETISLDLGIMRKQVDFCSEEAIILSSPMVGLLNPFLKSPRRDYSNPKHYDLSSHINVNPFVRRAVFQLNKRIESIPERLNPKTANGISYGKDFKLVLSRRLDPETERTLQSTIVAPGHFHTDSLTGVCFENYCDLLQAAGYYASVPMDFFVKVSGKKDLKAGSVRELPLPVSNSTSLEMAIASRVLYLNCLGPLFAELWDAYEEKYQQPPVIASPLIGCTKSVTNSKDFYCNPPTDKDKYRLLVELDVLASIGIGLRLGDLIAIYEVQFPVMRGYELNTYYDSGGMIVFTTNMGLPGLGIPRKGKGRGANKEHGWEDICEMTCGTVSRTILDDTLPGGPVERTISYEAPFDRCDRVKDYRIAWEFFEKEGVGT